MTTAGSGASPLEMMKEGFRFVRERPALQSLLGHLELNEHITSIYGRFDPHIPGGSFVQGARNVQLETMGHFRPVADSRVLREIDRAIAAGGVGTA